MYQLVYDQQVMPHPTAPPDLYPHPQSPINQSAHKLATCTQLTPKTASVVPPEDGRLTPETCRVAFLKLFFQVGTTFINQSVQRTTLFLSALKANCLRFSTIVCDTQFTLIWFFSVFFGLMFNLRGPHGQNPRTTCGPRTTVWETLV
jgi:hypothetical protein